MAEARQALKQQKVSDSVKQVKMATTLPSLPSEVIEKIIAFLPLPDVCTCMLVCKEWKGSEISPYEMFSSEQFCKNYVLRHYNFDDEEEPSGHLYEWSDPDEWFHYWDDNEDNSNVWVFSNLPKRWKCGIVHLASYSLASVKQLKYKDFLQAVYILMRIKKAAEELELDCGAWANEGTGLVETCLFTWDKESLPTATDIISLYGFNPEMHKNPLERAGDGDQDTDDERSDNEEEGGCVRWKSLSTSYDVDVQKAHAFFDWWKKIFSPYVQYGIGCEAMNPVPCFILAKLAPGWVGGVLSSLALT